MKYAVIKTGGKQYKVSEGSVIEVERLATPQGENIIFPEVLLVAGEDKTQFGTPFVSGMTVTGEILEHNKGEKLRISKYKAKVRYRRVTGHRQSLSTVKISMIGNTPAKKPVVAKPVEASTDTVESSTPVVKKAAAVKKTTTKKKE